MKVPLLNARKTEVICKCDAHQGELIIQIDAQLPNGKPIAIMKDWWGIHVAIGARNSLGQYPYTPPVSEEEAEQMIKEAMKT